MWHSNPLRYTTATYQGVEIDASCPGHEREDQEEERPEGWPLSVDDFGEEVVAEKQDEVGEKNTQEKCAKVQWLEGHCIYGAECVCVCVYVCVCVLS